MILIKIYCMMKQKYMMRNLATYKIYYFQSKILINNNMLIKQDLSKKF